MDNRCWGVLPCPEISDHDAAYIIVNIRVPRFVPRFKYIRNEKNLNIESFVTDFSQLPFNLVYAVSDPEEKLDIFNKLILGCLDNHAPLIRIRVTRPPAPWMKDLNIRSLQSQRDVYRYNAHHTGSESDWQILRKVRNQLKKSLKKPRNYFIIMRCPLKDLRRFGLLFIESYNLTHDQSTQTPRS